MKRLFIPWLLWNLVYGIVVTFLRNTDPFNFTMGMDLSLYSLYRLFTIGDSFSLYYNNMLKQLYVRQWE